MGRWWSEKLARRCTREDPMMAGVARNAFALLVATLVCVPTSVWGLEGPAQGRSIESSGRAVAGRPDAAVLAWVKALRCAPTRWGGRLRLP